MAQMAGRVGDLFRGIRADYETESCTTESAFVAVRVWRGANELRAAENRYGLNRPLDKRLLVDVAAATMGSI